MASSFGARQRPKPDRRKSTSVRAASVDERRLLRNAWTVERETIDVVKVKADPLKACLASAEPRQHRRGYEMERAPGAERQVPISLTFLNDLFQAVTIRSPPSHAAGVDVRVEDAAGPHLAAGAAWNPRRFHCADGAS